MNHVAMSVPSETLAGQEKTDLCRYFSEVLGFEELPTMTVDGKRLVLSCVHWDQFIFLMSGDAAMACPPGDHYGFGLGTLDELVAARDRALVFAKNDDRLELDDLRADTNGPVRVHSIYLTYLLPMRCELQYWEFLK